MSRLPRIIIAGIAYFYPRQTLEWAVATVLAFVAAWLTVEKHGIAPIGQFELMCIVYYAIIMFNVGLLDRPGKPAKA